jgi:hypothetical protein
MDWSSLPRDGWLALIAAGVGLLFAVATVLLRTAENPGWPIKLYLFIIDAAKFPGLRSYTSSRKSFSLREQFLASWFIWFFVLFLVFLFFWGCSRRGC